MKGTSAVTSRLSAPTDANLSLGFWRPGENGIQPEFVAVREITPEEWTAFHEAAASYGQLTQRPTHALVRRNFHRLQSIVTFYEHLDEAGGSFRRVNQRNVPFFLMADVVNWLTSVRLYLESERDRLARRYGENTVEIHKYVHATQYSFDTFSGYRFTYNLRDYAQHCGAPIATVDVHAREDGTRAVSIMLDREQLLGARFHWSRHAKEVLASLPPKFSLMPLIEDAMLGVEHIEEALLHIDLDDALRQRSVLHDALDHLGDIAGHPVLLALPRDLDGGDVQWMPLPDRAAVALLDELARSADPLVAARAPHESDARGFARTEGQRHVNGLAQRLLAEMLVTDETRTGPAFRRSVQRITEHHPIEDLMIGLANVSLYFVHLAAQAIGADPEELVARID